MHHRKEKTDVAGSSGQNEQKWKSQTSDELGSGRKKGKG